MDRVEVVPMNEGIVDNDTVVNPNGMPSPSGPTTPSAAQEGDDGNAGTEKQGRRARRKIPNGIGIVDRRSPDPNRVLDRHVQHFRVRGNDFDHGLGALGRCDHLLLWS